MFHNLDGEDCAFQTLRAADDRAASLAKSPRAAREALGTLPPWFDAVEPEQASERIKAFETDHLLRHQAAPLAISHLVRRLDERFDGAPTLLLLDEAWWALAHGALGAAIDDWLRTLRKKNVSVVVATQAIADLTTSPFAATLLEQIPTRVFLPNARALEPSTQAHYRALGLNDRTIQLIGQATPKRDYFVSSPAGSVLIDFSLGPTALALCARSTPTDQRLLDATPLDQVLATLLGETDLEAA